MSMMQIEKKVYTFLCFFVARVYMFIYKTKNKEGVGRISSNLGYKIQKYIWQENCSHTMFGAKVHKLNIQVKKWHKQLV